jgi:hypothetical protein
MSPEEVRECAQLLRSGSDSERVDADGILKRLSGTDMYRFLDWSNNERTRRDTDAAASVSCGLVFALVGMGLILSGFIHSVLYAIVASLVGVCLIRAAVLNVNSPRRPEYSVERAVLERLQDPQTVPPLLSALQGARAPVREYIIQALDRLLPLVKASDSAMFYPSQRRILDRIISVEFAGYPSEMIVKVLDALAQIGDKTNLPAVRQVARTRYRRNEWIQTAARRCESAIELKLLEKRHAESLLRPAREREQPTLLRAVRHEALPEDTLLRTESG